MGDEILNDDGFTPEELAALGEDEEETAEAKTEESEEVKETKEAEVAETKEVVATEDDEPRVPQSRVDEIVSEKKETQHKLDLLKSDPSEYYRRYPAEKPAEKAAAATSGKDTDVGNLVVSGGAYDGKTVDEVLQLDQAAGTKMILEYYREQDKQLAEAKSTEEKRLAESEAEVNAFTSDVATELFGKKASELDANQTASVNKVINDTLDFMSKTGRGGGLLADAYYLMNRENDKAKARGDGAKKLIDKLTKSSVASTSSGKDSGTETGYVADMDLTAQQLADKLDSMNDAQMVKYLKNAPKEMRDKYPHLPW